jgi:ornithine carbamoyltransferase
MQHLTNLSDLGPAGLIAVLDEADRQRATRAQNSTRPLTGKQIALVFEKASTRTRLSLEIAVSELGGHPIVLTQAGSQMGRGEPVSDSARVLGRMVHAITFRTSDESRLRDMIRYSGVPVLNALTDQSHPMQLCADLQVVRSHFGTLDGIEFAWIGDGNNMAHSWLEAVGLIKGTLRLAYPKGFEAARSWVNEARTRGARIEEFEDPADAVRGAHVISTDVFASMGQEAEAEARKKAFSPYQVNEKLVALARKDAVVLHCLPAHRGEEISEGVLESAQSIVWDQAEARLHTAKALLLWSLGLLPTA